MSQSIAVRQVEPWLKFPSGGGWEVASSPTTWEDYRGFGLTFEQLQADHDTFHFAAISDEGVGQLWILSYDNPPSPLTKYMVDIAFSRAEGLSAIRRTLGDVDLDWVTPLDHYQR